MKGTVTRVFLPKGYAFVRGDDGHDYFLQAEEFAGHWSGEAVHAGVKVEFTIALRGGKGNGRRAAMARVL